MAAAPSLLHLCALALARLLEQDTSCWSNVAELPFQLLSIVLDQISPLALIALQKARGGVSIQRCNPEVKVEESRQFCQGVKSSLKGAYSECMPGSSHASGDKLKTIFASTWKNFFSRRWPDITRASLVSPVLGNDYGCYSKSSPAEKNITWDQLYWQAHLQECINEASVAAAVPNFKGCIGDILISEKLMKQVSSQSSQVFLKIHFSDQNSTLKYACTEFSTFLRYLRLQSVLCSIELAGILKEANLQWIKFYNIKRMTDLSGVCQLLTQNKASLEGVQFFNCNFTELSLNKVCNSLNLLERYPQRLQQLALVSSRIQPASELSCFLCFLRNNRSLCSLELSGIGLQQYFAASVAGIALESSIPLSVLCLNDNELGPLFAIETTKMLQVKLSSSPKKQFQSGLTILDLRSNCLNGAAILNLISYIECLPGLRLLNLSNNPVGDDGIQALFPYLKHLSVSNSSLIELRLAACNISIVGATLLFQALASPLHPLRCLSIADNYLGRTCSAPLAQYLNQSSIQDLDIAEIGLDPLGCSTELQYALKCNRKLANLNISKNRIGSAGASLLSAITSEGESALTKINASFNLITFDSMCVLRSALQLNYKSQHLAGKIQCLDLRGNPGCLSAQATQLFEEFCTPEGDSVVLLSNDHVSNLLHDDDP